MVKGNANYIVHFFFYSDRTRQVNLVPFLVGKLPRAFPWVCCRAPPQAFHIVILKGPSNDFLSFAKYCTKIILEVHNEGEVR